MQILKYSFIKWHSLFSEMVMYGMTNKIIVQLCGTTGKSKSLFEKPQQYSQIKRYKTKAIDSKVSIEVSYFALSDVV